MKFKRVTLVTINRLAKFIVSLSLFIAIAFAVQQGFFEHIADSNWVAKFVKEQGKQAVVVLMAMGAAWRDISPAAGEHVARAGLYLYGPEVSTDMTLLAWARSDATAHDKAWRELATLPQRWNAPIFPLKADDFIRRGVAKGPALGKALKAAEAAWIGADFPADRAALDQIADQAVKQV